MTSLKNPLQGKKSITLNIVLFNKKELKQNILIEVKLEIFRVPRLRNGSPLQGF